MLYTETDNYYEFYEFELIPSSEVVKKNRNDTNLSVMFSSLEGGTKYSIKVTAVSGNQYSQSKVIQIRTGKSSVLNLTFATIIKTVDLLNFSKFCYFAFPFMHSAGATYFYFF